MSNVVTGVRYARGTDLDSLASSAAAAISAGFTAVLGPPGQVDGTWVQAMGTPAAAATPTVSADANNSITVGSDGGAFFDASV